MRILRRLFIFFALLISLIWLAISIFPPLRHALEIVKLFRESMPSHLPVPVTGIVKSQLVNTWGAIRSEGRRHEGIDIFAARGTPVTSTTRGIVVRVGVNRLGGHIIGVLGPGGFYHYYAHLDAYGPYHEGDLINISDILGYVGDTGNAQGTPAHLHYGIYRFLGKAINPFTLLTGKRF